MFCQRPEYIAHKVGQSIQQLKGKYKFAWALLTERPFLCKLIQTLDVELIDYVCGQLGVEKVNPEQALASPKRAEIVHVFTAVLYPWTDDSEERLIELGMTGLPLVPGAPIGLGLDAANMAGNSRPRTTGSATAW